VSCPVFASYTLTFALELRKKNGKTSVRVSVVLLHLYQKDYQEFCNPQYLTVKLALFSTKMR